MFLSFGGKVFGEDLRKRSKTISEKRSRPTSNIKCDVKMLNLKTKLLTHIRLTKPIPLIPEIAGHDLALFTSQTVKDLRISVTSTTRK